MALLQGSLLWKANMFILWYMWKNNGSLRLYFLSNTYFDKCTMTEIFLHLWCMHWQNMHVSNFSTRLFCLPYSYFYSVHSTIILTSQIKLLRNSQCILKSRSLWEHLLNLFLLLFDSFTEALLTCTGKECWVKADVKNNYIKRICWLTSCLS